MKQTFVFLMVTILCGSTCHAAEQLVLDEHKVHVFEFVITNSTGTAQTVKDVRLSCACLRIVSDISDKIAPRGALPVQVAFNPAGMAGNVAKTAEFTLSPSDETVSFEMSAFVKVRCGLQPCRAALGAVNLDQLSGVSRHLALVGHAVTGKQVKIVSVEGPSNSVFSVGVDEDGMGLSVCVAKGFAPRVGSFAETWKVATTDEEVKTITLPIAMDVVGELEVIPSRLKLRSRPGTQSLSVLIRPCKGGDIAIISAETKPRKWGDVRLHLRGKTGWRIDIDGVEYDKVRQFSKQPFLEVSTNSRQMPTVRIPLETL